MLFRGPAAPPPRPHHPWQSSPRGRGPVREGAATLAHRGPLGPIAAALSSQARLPPAWPLLRFPAQTMSVVLGLCTIDLSIPESNSLKDKRQVIRSLLDGLRSKFNVSAAEVESLDKWRTATLGIACVSNDARFNSQVLNKVLDTIHANPRVSVLDYEMETL